MNTGDTKGSFTHVRNTTIPAHAHAQAVSVGWCRCRDVGKVVRDIRRHIHVQFSARCNSSRGFLPTTYSSSLGVTWPLLMDLLMSQRVFRSLARYPRPRFLYQAGD